MLDGSDSFSGIDLRCIKSLLGKCAMLPKQFNQKCFFPPQEVVKHTAAVVWGDTSFQPLKGRTLPRDGCIEAFLVEVKQSKIKHQMGWEWNNDVFQ